MRSLKYFNNGNVESQQRISSSDLSKFGFNHNQDATRSYQKSPSFINLGSNLINESNEFGKLDMNYESPQVQSDFQFKFNNQGLRQTNNKSMSQIIRANLTKG